MRCQDWRDASADELAPLYARERDRWRRSLGWDVQPSWAVVETARVDGILPGLVVRDRTGTVTGWSFHLLSGDILQIGGLIADSAGGIRYLLDQTLASPEAGIASTFSCFVFPGSSAFESALGRRRFSMERYPYLRASLDTGRAAAPPVDGVAVQSWQDRDAADAVRLLASSYAGEPAAGCFAPHGRIEEWAHYLSQVLGGPACGALVGQASFSARSVATQRLVGMILTSEIAPDTAHVVQLVTSQEMRGRGLGRALLSAAFDAAGQRGYRQVTLLVAEGNRRAYALYGSVGFEPVSAFLYGSRPRPGRSASARPATAVQSKQVA